ncbi:MAG: copper chaperone PCu(A)C [Candidatus Latescibacterota bacterium]
MEVVSAWVLPAPKGRVTTAAYLVLENRTAQAVRLVGAQTEAAFRVEIHQSVYEGDVLRMRAVDSLVVPAHGRQEMRPGGLHLMLIDVHEPLEEGDAVALVLRLEQDGQTRRLRVKAPVRAVPASGAQ